MPAVYSSSRPLGLYGRQGLGLRRRFCRFGVLQQPIAAWVYFHSAELFGTRGWYCRLSGCHRQESYHSERQGEYALVLLACSGVGRGSDSDGVCRSRVLRHQSVDLKRGNHRRWVAGPVRSLDRPQFLAVSVFRCCRQQESVRPTAERLTGSNRYSPQV